MKHFWWKESEFGMKEVDCIKLSTLHIERNKIYFENLKFIDTCSYSKIEFKKFFESADKESDYSEDYQFMFINYTKDELSAVKRIELNCKHEGNCLGSLYLKQDTLILNFCGGLTFFMTKAPTKK